MGYDGRKEGCEVGEYTGRDGREGRTISASSYI